MKIRNRIILVILIISGLFVGWLTVQMHEDKKELDMLANEMASSRQQRFQTSLKMTGMGIKSLADDYSYWDEMVTFIKKRDTGWAYANLSTGLATFKADAAWVLNPEFNEIYSLFSKGTGRLETRIGSGEYRKIFKKNLFPHFFVNTKAGLVEIRGAPVQPVSDTERRSRPRGYFMAGKLWKAEDIAELASVIGSNVELLGKGASLPVHNPKEVVVHLVEDLPGWDGRPAARFHIDDSPPLYDVAVSIMKKQNVRFIFFPVVILGVMTLFLFKWVYAPLAVISKTLDTQNPALLEELKKEPTELGTAAHLIKQFFEQREELKMSEAALLEEKNKMKMILDNVADAISIQDTGFRVIYQNKTMVEMTGEHIGEHCYEAYHGAQDVCTGCPVAASLKDGVVCSQEKSVQWDNETHYIGIAAAPLRDLSGNIFAAVESIRDITERKMFEEYLCKSTEQAMEMLAETEKQKKAVQAQKEFTENLLQNSTIPTFVLDNNHRVIIWNKACEELTGLNASEVIGTDEQWRAYYGRRRPLLADIALDGEFSDMSVYYSTYRWSSQSSGSLRAEGWFPALNGKDSYLLFDSSPIRNSDGEIIAAIETLQDITDRKNMEDALRESEQKMHTLAEMALNAFIMMDNDGKIAYWNPAAERMFGYTSQEAMGKDLHALLAPGRYYSAYKSGFAHFRDTGLGMAVGNTLEIEALRKDGTEFPIELSISSVRLKEKWNAIGILRDITERKKAEKYIRELNEDLDLKVQERTRQLMDTQDELVRKEKLATLGQVVGIVGHELRNPLGVMSNAVYYLKTVLTDADETTAEYLDIIKDEIIGAERIVSDLLDSVRTKPPNPNLTAIKELVYMAMDKCRITDNVSVTMDLPESLPMVSVDTQQMKQVFINLINNAVDAMPRGGTLTIKAEEDRDNKLLLTSVCDTGTGVAPENIDKLFQPLFTTKARGIGLGLSVVKNLTEANGGRVDVESQPGNGTTFTVALPITGGAA